MGKGRLEAFSDAVIAIILTIMVLELKVPHGSEISSLIPLVPVFISYVLSFIYVGIYWNNHHHMIQAAKTVNGGILWANSHLLFWLSLIPFVTGWMGENHFDRWPVFCYGFVLLMNAVSYTILTKKLVKHHGEQSTLSQAMGSDRKGKLSLVIYITALLLTFVNSWIAFGLYVVVAIMWFIPDTRIEKKLEQKDN